MPVPKKGDPKPEKKVDKDELAKLARLHLTNIEIADWFGCTSDLLSRSPYIEIIQKAKSETKQHLKQKAMQRALHDNSDTMLIFCLKNYCKWGDQGPTDESPGNGTIKIEFVKNGQAE